MRQQLLRSIVLLTVVSSGAVLGVAIFFAQRSVETLSRSLIEQTAERTELALERFFRPIEGQLQTMRRWGRDGLLDVEDPKAFLKLVGPFLEAHPEVAGVELTGENGVEIFVLVEEGSYAIRRIKAGKSRREAVWTRWRDGRATDTWRETTRYNVFSRPWFTGALALENTSSVFWTEPYTFFTTKLPGITASTRYNFAGQDWVVGVDLALIDISEFTTKLSVSEHGAVAVLTESGQTIGLPKDDQFRDVDTFRRSMLKPVEVIGVPFMRGAITAGRKLQARDRRAYRFENDGSEWWGGSKRFALSAERPLLIQAAVPAADLVGDLERQRNIILLVIAVSLAVAITLAYVLGKRYEARISAAVSKAQRLGQYTLEKQIGSGGMGSVYRARHALLRRPTAIKLLNPRSDDPHALDRFEREVQLTAQLTHPNTIAVYDYGRTAQGVFYYAMEYLEGLSLRQLVKRFGPLPEARAIHFLRQIAGSLEEAHRAGLVHRDIKPANIFITERGGQRDFVKVLDFGLVEKTNTQPTETKGKKLIVGTPAYMAPEVIRDPERVTPLIDIYALGCVGYFLLTGAPVFRADDQRSIYMMQLEKTPLPPSERAEQKISRDMNALIMRCLSKKPSERPQTMEEIIERLDELPQADAWDAAHSRGWWRDHRYQQGAEPESDREDRALDNALESIAVDLAGRDSPTVRGGTRVLDEAFSYPALSAIIGSDEAQTDVSDPISPLQGLIDRPTQVDAPRGI
ncbi:MAG: protein kinase [Myxococcota bacterium]